jgi:hypothetical protein
MSMLILVSGGGYPTIRTRNNDVIFSVIDTAAIEMTRTEKFENLGCIIPP